VADDTVVWVADTSSIIAVRRSFPNVVKARVFNRLTELVEADRLIFPTQVLQELERVADPNAPDDQYNWARANAQRAVSVASCSLEEVKAVLEIVPDILDIDKDVGVDEADPYILTVARRLRQSGVDARIVTEERKDSPTKMSLNTAAGILGIPSLPLAGLIVFEKLPRS
jgi:hypothetical protein